MLLRHLFSGRHSGSEEVALCRSSPLIAAQRCRFLCLQLSLAPAHAKNWYLNDWRQLRLPCTTVLYFFAAYRPLAPPSSCHTGTAGVAGQFFTGFPDAAGAREPCAGHHLAPLQTCLMTALKMCILPYCVSYYS